MRDIDNDVKIFFRVSIDTKLIHQVPDKIITNRFPSLNYGTTYFASTNAANTLRLTTHFLAFQRRGAVHVQRALYVTFVLRTYVRTSVVDAWQCCIASIFLEISQAVVF